MVYQKSQKDADEYQRKVITKSVSGVIYSICQSSSFIECSLLCPCFYWSFLAAFTNCAFVSVQIIKQVLGKVLYFPETEGPMKEFPCPESLKGRIMVSTKPPKEYLESQAEITPALQEKLEEEDTQEEKVEELVKDKAEEGWGEEVPDYVAKPLDEVTLIFSTTNACFMLGAANSYHERIVP